MSLIGNAILEINPTAVTRITLAEDGTPIIEWLDGTAEISKADIDAKVAEIQTRDAHIEPRGNAYPSIKEQLDMQYHDNVDGTTTWQDTIQAVKDANPKA